LKEIKRWSGEISSPIILPIKLWVAEGFAPKRVRGRVYNELRGRGAAAKRDNMDKVGILVKVATNFHRQSFFYSRQQQWYKRTAVYFSHPEPILIPIKVSSQVLWVFLENPMFCLVIHDGKWTLSTQLQFTVCDNFIYLSSHRQRNKSIEDTTDMYQL